MNTPPLLIELLTEELPPEKLRALAESFAKGLTKDLREDNFLSGNSEYAFFATPRRLAVRIDGVFATSPANTVMVKGPSVAGGFDGQGKPTPALFGFAKKHGVAIEALQRMHDGKQDILVHHAKIGGRPLRDVLGAKIGTVLEHLPIAKMMSYQLADGATTVRFARPAHRLVALHGHDIVPCTVLGLAAGRITEGHRLQGAREIMLAHSGEYERKLESEGKVIADFDSRRTDIVKQLSGKARQLGARLGADQDIMPLLDEVTALVEWPAVYAGEFEREFLDVPQECLVLTMRAHQKYFPLFDEAGKLINRFLIVSNIRLDDPANVVEGNQRVVRPRLADARFFFDTDRRTRLETRVPELAKVVYHNKLGSQLERVERVQLLAGGIARLLGADAALAERAAWLAKADLLTNMVGEFPELQGVMGRYYALNEREPAAVADAIAQHYRPRYAGDALPEGAIALALALADKLYTLAGLFGIGQQPTGASDPFALRRHALGIIRILIEKDLGLSLRELIDNAFAVFPHGLIRDAHSDLEFFILERLRGHLRDEGYTANEVESVLSKGLPVQLNKVPLQLAAVRAFASLPEAQSLAAANKRVANILKQAEARGESFINADIGGLKDPAEQELFKALDAASRQATTLFQQGDFAGYLKTFAILKSPVDAFFDSVMVMTEDTELRRNRLALLADLREAMNRIADISKLAA